ncbi:lysylphosphatidylglycerol synthase transmembrane domain-containing protein [soil metagenome]
MASLSPRWRSTLRIVLTVVVVAAVGVLFARTLAENWTQVVDSGISFSWLWIVAIVVFSIAVPLSGILWGRIVAILAPTVTVGLRESMAVHCASWLLKYIPGQVGSIVNKVAWGSRKGISRTLIIITFLYENVFLQVASLVPGIIIIVVALGSDIVTNNGVTAVLLLVALIPLVGVLVPRVFHGVISFASRRILKQPVPHEYFLSIPNTLGLLVGFVGPRLLNGLGFVLLAATIVPVPADQWLFYGAVYVVAGAIGILAVFVPSGLGVREGVIFACLVAGGVSPAHAVIISLLSRLLSTIADAVVAAIYAGLRLSLSKGSPS